MTTRFRPLDDGWYAWLDDARGVTIKVRVYEGDDGRVRINGLQIEGPVSAEVLRSIPIGRLEAAANAELHGSIQHRPRRRPSAIIAASLRENASRGYSDAFYEAVAATYRHLAGTSSRPVGDIAAANDVPITTAQRWVKEARRRGLLAAGHPGKAG